MTRLNLPADLHRHFVNLSTTIQSLITEIVLTVEGMSDVSNRSDVSKIEQSAKASRANELIVEKLNELFSCNKLNNDDSAICLAAMNGKNVKQISDFFGMNVFYVRRRLCALKKMFIYRKETKNTEVYNEKIEILRIFADAQKESRFTHQ